MDLRAPDSKRVLLSLSPSAKRVLGGGCRVPEALMLTVLHPRRVISKTVGVANLAVAAVNHNF